MYMNDIVSYHSITRKAFADTHASNPQFQTHTSWPTNLIDLFKRTFSSQGKLVKLVNLVNLVNFVNLVKQGKQVNKITLGKLGCFHSIL